MGNICVIGPRDSGKTTYLAGLAYWPDKQKKIQKSSSFNVQALGDAKILEEKAENIICQGDSLPPTEIASGIDDAPLYQFQIKVNTLLKKNEEINLVVRDYPGEIFEELETGFSSSLNEEFINESLIDDVEGCLILLSDWTKDSEYSKMLKKYIELMDKKSRLNKLRLAVVMSKCERGEIWSGRLEPEMDIFDVHLPKTKQILRANIQAKNLQFYALSTFGVLGRNDPRPNRKDVPGKNGSNAVLRESTRWKPYNMIAPLYWLSKGRRI
ncbi:hypothetical protein DSM106972_092780 [Dulcicalothrix desertica PCC 7102]|uniref:G domain-containing protein n=1 Tax=Dulcicalothrix desertica PCC 7102 TaxID=232991 RepID=A0A433ULA0_9CYAN|nr:hypothetical protein [Dulcicalothrix desertica]RUS94641.1 hypothetical protein DSM106972_092780 [Dulcicalothrix desertica PCC 7102]TWH62535.1 hypothetical protein CAL7102_00026 [Dulcicalothrix desertica PCC 7102]